MPSSKDDLALRWAQASEEEKSEKRRKHAEAQKRYREKKARKERSEMNPEDIEWKRALDRKNKKNSRMNMTKEKKDAIKAMDRERKAKERREKKKDKSNNTGVCKKDATLKNIDLNSLGNKKLKQRKDNCRTNKKFKDGRTDEDKEKHDANLTEILRRRRSLMTEAGKSLSRIKAKEGMRLCRNSGYLRKYKQRKCRDEFDASCYARLGVNKNGFSSLSWLYIRKQERFVRKYRKNQKKTLKLSKLECCKLMKENSGDIDKKEKLKKMNRIRVQRHRRKVKKMLEEPIILEEFSEKGPYELLREKNIRELDMLKKESGLFD